MAMGAEFDALVELSFGRLDCRDRALQLLLRPLEPVGAPDSMDDPSVILQNRLAQPVAIPRRP